MKHMIIPILFLLAGCSSLPTAGPQAALYDFGIDAPSAEAAASQLRLVRVDAAAGLAGSEMRYRLAYQNPARVFFYTESHWVAPPAKLLARHFQQRLAHGNSAQCALSITVETFEQVFDAPDSSRGVVRLNARLSMGDGRQARAHLLQVTAEHAAPSADARGGVAALIAAADAGFTRILDWTATLPCESSAHTRP